MVKLNPDIDKLKGLDSLRKKIDEKEQEYKEREEEKRKELEDLEKKREKDLKEVERKLEEAVKILEDTSEEQEIEETREHATDTLLRTEEEISLEQSVQEAQEVQEGAGGPAYEIGKSDLEALPDLYGAVHDAISAGRADSPVIQQAMDLVYSLDKKDAYISTEARGMFTRDQVEDQYIKRLGALLDTLAEKTGTGEQSEWYG